MYLFIFTIIVISIITIIIIVSIASGDRRQRVSHAGGPRELLDVLRVIISIIY